VSADGPVYRPRPISGFVEWLPEQRLVEQRWLDEIRRGFERYGFCSIETPSVEELDVLLAKGETDKELYVIRRLAAEGDEDARLGLHYDLTVPFARYVAQHLNDLVFPFKRYQIQRVWRGERPQEGRFREFYQCDIDVIDHDEVALSFDAEMPAIVHDILGRLDLGALTISISNR
jgi:histidyl-tRNA synthetase